MEIFNVSIPEILLIAGLALVVFGPERLPEIGRLLGKQMAKLLAWQQNSPEIQMLNEVRSEFESEIASLRDELVRTRKQLDVSKDITAIKEELRPMLNLRDEMQTINAQIAPVKAVEPTIKPLAPIEPPALPATATVGVTPPPVGTDAVETTILQPTPAAKTVETTILQPTPAGKTVPAAVRPTKIPRTEPTTLLTPARPSGTAQEMAEINQRLQQLATDMQALIAELQARGHLDPEWQAATQVSEQESVAP